MPLSETPIFSAILLVAALAVGAGAAMLARMLIRDIIDRSREKGKRAARQTD